MKYSKAFTLLEMLTAMAIVSVVLGVGIPLVSDTVERNKTDNAKSTMMNAIVAARSEAVSRNQGVVLCTSSSGTACAQGNWEDGWIAYVDENGNGFKDIAEPVVSVYTIASNTTLRSDAANPFSLVFLSDGSVTADGDFRVCGADQEIDKGYSVIVGATGRPRSSKGVADCL